MATYVIGDVHACLTGLERLLTKVGPSSSDTIIFIGDLIGRGPQPWEVLTLVRQLQATIIIGNHDLSYIASAYKEGASLSTSQQELLGYYQTAHFAYHHQATNTLLVHAGVWHSWNLTQTLHYAQEAKEFILATQTWPQLKDNMYGNKEVCWDEGLSSWERYRCLMNIFTRLRTYTSTKEIDLAYTGTLADMPKGNTPWFSHCKLVSNKVIFGHWAALEGTMYNHCMCIDAGYIWGGAMLAYCLEDGMLFKESAP